MAEWTEVPSPVRAALQPKGFSPQQALTLVDKLGFENEEDLQHITDEDISGLQLKPLQERALLRLVHSARRPAVNSPPENSARMSSPGYAQPSQASQYGNPAPPASCAASGSHSGVVAALHEATRSAFEMLPWDEKRELRNIFDMVDRDGNGCITYDELLHWWRGMSPNVDDMYIRQQVRAYWQILDANGDGTLDMMEVMALLLMLGSCSPFGCDGCDTLIFDDYVWLNVESVQHYLSLPEEEQQENVHLGTSFCDACYRRGVAHHPLGLTLERVRNEWDQERVQDWSCFCCDQSNSYNYSYQDASQRYQQQPSHSHSACTAQPHKASRTQRFFKRLEAIASTAEAAVSVAECFMQ